MNRAAETVAAQMPLSPRAAPLADKLRRLAADPAARMSLYMIGNHVLVALWTGLQFFLLARALGAHEFGKLASVAAVTAAFIPFCGLGLANMAIIRISRRESSPEQSLGNGLAVTALTAAVGLVLVVLISVNFLHQPDVLLLALLVGTSELLLTKCIDLAAHVFIGLDKPLVGAGFFHLLSFVRFLCAVVLFLGWTAADAVAWAQLYLGSSVFTAAITLFVCVRKLGTPRVRPDSAVADAKKGVLFSIVISAKGVYTDVDKFFMGRSAPSGDTGAYTASFRLTHLMCLPVVSILQTLQARIFRSGHKQGIAGTLDALRFLMLLTFVYSLVVAVVIYAAGPPLVPWLLGESYRRSSEMFQALCLLPLLVSFNYMGNDALSGADAQRRVTLLHALTAGISLVLNLVLVPLYGWEGAVVSAYASQGFLAASLILSIFVLKQEAER